ncbi:PD-(D/E)XK nuclease family protein [Haloterrigena alkaliphila]|uniref:PD-(D/E)XK nuclease family protein n=1 Tax=Haloterrigena alkaliphila TaxID=2816475 RepID=A0A8A2VHE8_9EURY|nr:PD-(D/E)XK nuclease family protein [Haloterrigena alkaliphila]QSW97658.1 PD-(D/E)XK nuclease family protein [Haloterrigena alkaliphila]
MGEDILELDTERIEDFIDRYLELDRRAQQPYGVFSFLSGRREKKYQQTLKYFLDPHKPHGFGDTFLEVFLEVVDVPELNVAAQYVEIEEEVHIADESSDSRIDLVICGGQALDDHPDWAVFLELKVGADENENQTPTYTAADSWQFTWFDTTEINVDELDEATYVYVKKAVAEPPEDDEFDAVDWAAIAKTFEHRLQGSLFQYPNRSVIQFTDFIQSLQETENMDSPFKEDELTERLKLYFEYDDVIQQVEQAHRQFENDFDDVSKYLTAQWADKIRDRFRVTGSGWKIRSNDSPKWQGLMPEYWDQDPFGWDSTIALYFRIPSTTEQLRNQELSFRLRLPPQRKVHKQTFEGDGSFNAVFTEKCTGEYEDEIRGELEKLDVDEINLERASSLFTKNYDLDPENLVSSYFVQVTTAVDEFCSESPQLLTLMNSVFEESYEDVFGEPPAGEFSGSLSKRE